MKIFRIFGKVNTKQVRLISLFWLISVMTYWILYSINAETHLFPTIGNVLRGFKDLWNEGMVTHIGHSLALCFKAILISITLSMIIVYLSPIPLLKPISTIISKFRYLPLTGITFYVTMLINDARSIQVWILVIFMSTFLITSLFGMLKDIPENEFNHARALGCSKIEILLEVVIKGRLDYILECIRQNLAIVWMMLVTVESILLSNGGLGFLIKNSSKFMNHGRIIALQIVILLIGLLLDYLLTTLRKGIFRYSKF